MKSIRLVVLALALATATSSCGVTERASTVSVTDSLGIRVVENTGTAWDPADVPLVDEETLVRFGTVDGDPRYQLFRVRGAVRLTSGDIVVAVAGTQELRWFTAGGEWIRSVGGPGSGPGEFQGMRSLMLLPGDSLLVEDAIAARMTLYDAEGRLLRSWSTESAGSPSPIGRLPDGSLVAISERSINEPPGMVKFAASLVRYATGTAAAPDTIGTFAGTESFTAMCGPDNSGLCNLGLPYGPRTVAAVSGDAIFAGNGATYELFAFEHDKGLTSIIRRDVPPAALDEERVAWYRDSLVAGLREPRRSMVLERQQATPAPATMAAFSRIVADDVGRVWLARPSPMVDPRSSLSDSTGGSHPVRQWDVFDADGRFLGVVPLPVSLQVTSIANGYIAGVARDADGVEYVEVRRLRQGGASRR